MAQTFNVSEITIGYHPAGYRIDRNASPMNLYTKWEIAADGRWANPQAVCFDSLPQEGWRKMDDIDSSEGPGAARET